MYLCGLEWDCDGVVFFQSGMSACFILIAHKIRPFYTAVATKFDRLYIFVCISFKIQLAMSPSGYQGQKVVESMFHRQT